MTVFNNPTRFRENGLKSFHVIMFMDRQTNKQTNTGDNSITSFNHKGAAVSVETNYICLEQSSEWTM